MATLVRGGGTPPTGRDGVIEWLDVRSTANAALFAAESERIALLCAQLAERFAAGGRLIAFGMSPAARSDARHVAVEFVHPVIVGKRALPAIGLTADAGVLAQVETLATSRDVVLAFGCDGRLEGAERRAVLGAARAAGCLTVAFDHIGADHEFVPPIRDAFAQQELVETLYHVVWELVHVFFEHGAIPHAEESDPGSSAFLYPFLTRSTTRTDEVMRDVAASARAKAEDASALRRSTISDGDALRAVARDVRRRLEAGGALLAFGNGGSATDAMDLVADLRAAPFASFRRRRALDLTEDTSIITALANDVGMETVFARQIAAYGAKGDVAVAFSTSGSSTNILAALREARRRGLFTLAFTGYDGGEIVADGLADVAVVAPSQYVPRIQEAHASAYHILRALIG